jgi:uncharacterized protein YvpB
VEDVEKRRRGQLGCSTPDFLQGRRQTEELNVRMSTRGWILLLFMASGAVVWSSAVVLAAGKAPGSQIAALNAATPDRDVAWQVTPASEPLAMPTAAEPSATAADAYATALGSAAASESAPFGLAVSDIPIQSTPPDGAYVAGFVGHRQSLALSCESRSAVDWAGFFGVKIDELDFFRGLPISGDPDLGFVGDVHGTWGQVPPNAYGVHAGPVARLLQQYHLPAYYQIHMPWESLQAEVAAGRPVIVWVTGHVEAGTGQLYTAADGHRTVVAPFEHTVIVVGYDPGSVTIEDEGQRYTRTVDQFLKSWQALRNMAITAHP